MTDPMIVGVPRECDAAENRVALVPAAVRSLRKANVEVIVESGAGDKAGFLDGQYEDVGARIVADRSAVFGEAQIVVHVQALGASADDDSAARLRSGQLLIAACDPLSEPEPVRAAAGTGALVFALELVPRITRAQSMDILSSMATIAGYRAVLLAAVAAPRMFPLMMTAAGTLKPARVLVIGAGVAGLQAIATARRLGAIVLGYDIRPAVREQVESLGANFVELDVEAEQAEGKGGYARQMSEDFYRRQREELQKVIAECDIVITTAAVPGRKAPVLITEDMAAAMAPGSVIVDIAAERGGNCALTQAGETVEHNGVRIIGPVNLPSDVPVHASEMFSRNVVTFLTPMLKDGQIAISDDDEVVRETLLTRNGEVIHPQLRERLQLPPLADAADNTNAADSAGSPDDATADSADTDTTPPAGDDTGGSKTESSDEPQS